MGLARGRHLRTPKARAVRGSAGARPDGARVNRNLAISAGKRAAGAFRAAGRALWELGEDLVPTPNRSHDGLAAYLSVKRNYHRARYLARRRDRSGNHQAVRLIWAALRQIGVYIPERAEIDGFAACNITRALAGYLEAQHGWKPIECPSQLRPGDLVFTRDAACCPGIPHHVFVFMGWKDARHRIAYATDHQGPGYPRPLSSRTRPSCSDPAAIAPFGYGLTAPSGKIPNFQANSRTSEYIHMNVYEKGQ